MATFENPNVPQQPQEGIYAWYAKKEGSKLTIYVGKAERSKKTGLPRGTLSRGVSELQRDIFCSNPPKKDALDTDFIVGTAIIYFEQECGYQCFWEHIDNNPENELKIVSAKAPILQGSNGKIKGEFKRITSSSGSWESTPDSVAEAGKKLFQQLKTAIGCISVKALSI